MAWVQDKHPPYTPTSVIGHNRIQEQRKKRKMTAEVLGKAIGSGRSTIVKLERGERRLNVDMMERIAAALGVAPADLLPTDKLGPDTTGVVMAPLVDAPDLEYLIKQGDLPPRERATFPLFYARQTLVVYKLTDSSIDIMCPAQSSVAIDYSDKHLNDYGVFLFMIGGRPTPRVYRCTEGPVRLEPFSHKPHTTIYPCLENMWPVIGRIVKAVVDLPSELRP